jgi:hypothetical protein
MSIDLQAIVKRLEAGESPGAIAASLRPEAEQELLRRCAVARTFDRELVDTVLRPFTYLAQWTSSGIQGPPREVGPIREEDVSWEALVGGPPVEQVPEPPGRDGAVPFEAPADGSNPEAAVLFRIRPSDRLELLGSWRSSAAALRTLHERLRDYWTGHGDPLEAMYHASAIDPLGWLGQFEKAFDAAEEAFDLARCADLLTAYAGQTDLPPDAKTSVAMRSARLAARGLWAEEYYRTARFLERPRLAAELARILAAERGSEWVLQLYAAGGMGKTQFLRWALARYCVPRSIPCARIDFDVTDAQTLLDQPGRLARILAESFSSQLPGAPLRHLLDGLARGSAGPDPLGRLASVLLESLPLRTPALVLLDTLEEVLLPRPGVLAELLRAMSGLHARCPALRLLLAGRYNIRDPERLGETCPIPQAESLDRVVPPFTEAESQAYLAGQIAELPSSVRERVVKLAEGKPLRLALYAELLVEDPEKTAEDLAREGRVELIYLIRRIILRLKLPDGERDTDLAFVLRYSAVPRVLTRDFLRDVIVPHAREAQRLDDLGAGLTPPLRDEEPFVPPGPGDLDADGLWGRLTSYAGKSSWVRVGSALGGSPALLLQTEILNPMRRLLRERPAAADLLHDVAIARYRDLASKANDPTARTQWTREAIYHDFQRHGAAAGARWRSLIDDGAVLPDPTARLALAEEVTGTAYLDDEGDAREWRAGQPLIAPADVAWAYRHQARASIELARRGDAGAERHWKEAAQALGRHDRLAARWPEAAIPAPTLAPLRAAVLAHQGNFAGALEAAKPALDASDPANRCCGWRVVGDAQMNQTPSDPSAAVASYRSALDAAREASGRIPPAEPFELRGLLAAAELARERMAEAYDACPDPAEVVAINPSLAARLDLQRRHILQSAGLDEMALSAPNLPAMWPEHDRYAADRTYQDAESLLHLLLPRAARASIAAPGVMTSSAPPRTPTAVRAVELDGRAAAALLIFPEAVDQLDNARKGWANLSRFDDADRVLAHSVAVRMRGLGDLITARILLDQWAGLRGTMPPTGPAVALEMLWVEWMLRKGDYEEATRLVERRLDEILHSDRPATVICVALQALALRDVAADRILDVLASGLSAITPSSARVARLESLERCPTLTGGVDAAIVARFLDSLEPIGDAREPRDRALSKLRAVEAYRIVGRVQDAARMLDDCGAMLLGDTRSAFPLPAILRAYDRLGRHQQALGIAAEHFGRFSDEFAHSPYLVATALLDQADRALLVGANDVAERAITDAARLIAALAEPWGRLPQARLHRAVARQSAAAGMAALASTQLESARRLYRELGDADSSKPPVVVTEALGAGRQAGPEAYSHAEIGPEYRPPLFPVRPAYRVVLRDRNGTRCVAEVTLPPSGDHRDGASVSRRDVDLERLTTGSSGADYTDEMAREYGQRQGGRPWRQLGVALAGEVLGPVADLLDSGSMTRAFDLEIEAQDAELASRPWELLVRRETVLTSAPGVRFFHRTIPPPGEAAIRRLVAALGLQVPPTMSDEGLESTLLRPALMALQRDEGLAETGVADVATLGALGRRAWRAHPPIVLVLHGFDVSSSAPGAAQITVGDRLKDLYARQGIAVESPRSPTARLSQYRELSPAVIHLAAPLDYDPSLDFHVKLGSDTSAMRITSTDLIDWIRSYPPGRPAPLIVLDPPWPGSLSEALRQLAQRNAFAAKLAGGDLAPAVVATGLGGYTRSPPEMADALVTAIAGGWTLGGLADQIRRQAPLDATYLDAVLGPLSTAIFCRDPEERALSMR